jgi:preprotein translocase subunit SecE
MTEHTEKKAGSGSLDWAWVALAALLVVGGLYVFYGLSSLPSPARVAAVLAGVLLGAGAFSLSTWGKTVWQFTLTSRVELRKVVWPTVEETRRTTLVVFLFVVILGLFFWLVDWVLAWVTRHLLGTGA